MSISESEAYLREVVLSEGYEVRDGCADVLASGEVREALWLAAEAAVGVGSFRVQGAQE